MKIPKIIHQTWKTKDIPYHIYREKWIDSWKQYHPDWEYRLWTDEDNRELIKEFYPWFLEIYDGYDSGIKKSDAARYFILHHAGGLYVDLDFECLKNLEPILEGHELVLGRMDSGFFIRNQIPNALMASAQGHPFWLSVMDQLHRRKHTRLVEPATGPIMLFETAVLYIIKNWLKRVFLRFRAEGNIKIYEPAFFYPVSWVKQSLYKNTISDRDILMACKKYPDAYAITYWCKNW